MRLKNHHNLSQSDTYEENWYFLRFLHNFGDPGKNPSQCLYFYLASESTVDDDPVLIGFTFSTADANSITLSLLRMFDSCSMSSLVLIIIPLRLLAPPPP